MMKVFRTFAGLVFVLGLSGLLSACGGFVGEGNSKASRPLTDAALAQLKAIDSNPAEAMMVRIFKESSELEVWKRSSNGQYRLFKTYEICKWSGDFGPKVKEGDRQSPEGFYTISPGLMNPNSNYYLAFNVGFPNKFDRAYGRTGSNLMVHGDCRSVGCFAMTDEGIAEIYALVRESFKGGNRSFQLQIFPFRMTEANLAKHASSPHLAFWKNLKEGHDRFEITKTPPLWDVCDKRYVFDKPVDGQPLDASMACPALQQDAAMMAALGQKQSADDAHIDKVAAQAAKGEQEKAAIKARGEAIGGFFGGLFGGGEDNVPKVMNPALVPPVPASPIARG